MGGKQLSHAEKDCIFKKQNPKKRPSSCPSLGKDSCSGGSQYKVQVNACKSSVKADASHIFEKLRKHECKSSNVKHYRTRFSIILVSNQRPLKLLWLGKVVIA